MICLWLPWLCKRLVALQSVLYAMCQQEHMLSQILVTSSSVTLLLMQACMPVQKCKNMSNVLVYLAVTLTIRNTTLSDCAGLG